MMSIILLSTIILASIGRASLAANFEGRIVNGTLAIPGEFPSIVALKYKGDFTCGASILDEYHVLTAAHCVSGLRCPHNFAIVYGTIDQQNNTHTIPVKKISSHKFYFPPYGYINDISVLRLRDAIPLSEYAKPTVLPPAYEPTPDDDEAVVAGWGQQSDTGLVMDVLQKANLEVYPDANCTRIYGVTNKKHHLCAGIPEGGTGFCYGDSGGPLFANGVQIGIVSWSQMPCASPGYPGVFTKVSMYVRWIKSKMRF